MKQSVYHNINSSVYLLHIRITFFVCARRRILVSYLHETAKYLIYVGQNKKAFPYTPSRVKTWVPASL